MGEENGDHPVSLRCVLMGAAVARGRWGASWVVPSLLPSRGKGEEGKALQTEGAVGHCVQGRAKSPVTAQGTGELGGGLETRMKGLLGTDCMQGARAFWGFRLPWAAPSQFMGRLRQVPQFSARWTDGWKDGW